MPSLTFFLILGLAIVIHEFGHYIVARMAGVKVYRFSVFFAPGFSIIDYDGVSNCLRLINRDSRVANPAAPGGYSLVSRPMFTLRLGREHPEASARSWRRTVFSLGWIPCGGYCSVADRYVEPGITPEPWTLAAKRPGVRIAFSLAGVFLNFVTGACALVAAYFFVPTQTLAPSAFPSGFAYGKDAHKAGFKDGDAINTIAGYDYNLAGNASSLLYYATEVPCRVNVTRDGQSVDIQLPKNAGERRAVVNDIYNMQPMGGYVMVAQSDDLPDGLEPGMSILAVDGTEVRTPEQFDMLMNRSEAPMLTIADSAGNHALCPVAQGFRIAVDAPAMPAMETHVHDFGFAVGTGLERAADIVGIIARHPVLLVSSHPASALIYYGTPSQYMLVSFAVLSIFLAIFNLLPIPGLDGSRIWLPIYEIATGKRAPESVRKTIDRIGQYTILAIFCWFIISIFV